MKRLLDRSALRRWWLDHFSKRYRGIGDHARDNGYIVRVYHGGYWVEESLQGPFQTVEEAAEARDLARADGSGAIIYEYKQVQV
jgi:hypothetical protein